MIEIELAIHIREFYQEALPWLKGQGSKYTLFSGRNIVAFESDEDATAFMLMFGGKRAHFVEEMQERFTEEAKRQRFESMIGKNKGRVLGPQSEEVKQKNQNP